MSDNRRDEVDAAIADVDFDANSYQVVFDTSKGKITIDMWSDIAPGHCHNMIGLAKIGYYDGIGFHRVISGFMIQGGCPEGTGTGGPGYTIDAEFNDREHVAGTLSMARTADPNSAGSQFFLCLGRVPHLDNEYTAFGQTADEDSTEVVMSIGALDTDHGDKPLNDVTINTATVVETAK